MRAISARIWTRIFASRFDSGSSIRNATGSRTIARPIATRWRCPPERWRGRFPSTSASPRISAADSTRRLISVRSMPRILRPNAMLS